MQNFENMGWEDYAGNFHKFDDLNFNNIFGFENTFEKQEETPEEKKLRETRYEIKKYYAEKTEKVYRKTIKSVEKELNNISPKYLFMSLIGLGGDLVYTLWDPIKGLINSPVIKLTIEEETKGKGKSILDLVKKYSKENPQEKQKSVDELKEFAEKSEKLTKTLADYAEKNKKTVYEVLKNQKDYAQVLKKSYGTFEEYEKQCKKGIKNMDDILQKIELFKLLPVGQLAETYLSSKAPGPLTDIGIKPGMIQEIIQAYVNDIITFTKAFIVQTTKQMKKDLTAYKKSISEK